MKLYSALIKKSKRDEVKDFICLEDSFSFSAFFFGPLWFVYHKMWHELLALVIINIIFEIFFASFDRILLELSLAVIIAMNANYWLCEHLKKKRYKFAGFVFGNNETDAGLSFIRNFSDREFDEKNLDSKSLTKLSELKNKIWKKIKTR